MDDAEHPNVVSGRTLDNRRDVVATPLLRSMDYAAAMQHMAVAATMAEDLYWYLEARVLKFGGTREEHAKELINGADVIAKVRL